MKTFLCFILSVFMTEEFFKLYRMIGDFMFKYLAYYIESKDLFDWRCCFYSVSDLGKSESLFMIHIEYD